jgi:hypothetical protein
MIVNRRSFAFILCLGVAVLTASPCAFAEDHLAKAIDETNEAVVHGKNGFADALITRAEVALEHADAAEKAAHNSHTEEAIAHLEAAIDHGRQKHIDLATKHAEDALNQLKAATSK